MKAWCGTCAYEPCRCGPFLADDAVPAPGPTEAEDPCPWCKTARCICDEKYDEWRDRQMEPDDGRPE